MNTYEALLVFKPVLDMENMDNVVKSVENTIQNLKGKILKVDKVGRKSLAYEISKFKDGFFTIIYMELDPNAVVEFKKYCQMSEDILRLTMLRQESFDPENTPTLTTAIGVPYGAGPRGDRDFRPRGPRGDFRGGDRGDFRGGDRGGERGDFRGGDRGEHRGEPRGAVREQPAREPGA